MVEAFLNDSNKKRWWNAMIFTLAFIIVANSATYNLVNSVLSWVVRLLGSRFGATGHWYFADALGCPTTWGFILHVIVFFLAARAIIEARALDQTQSSHEPLTLEDDMDKVVIQRKCRYTGFQSGLRGDKLTKFVNCCTTNNGSYSNC